MRTPSETLDFVTILLINDLNMLTVQLGHGTARMQGEDKRLPIIEITFKDISKSNWVNTLNTELKGFLQGQHFLVTDCYKDSLLIGLL
ncbi:MAG TPA: hypothetical protein DD730_12805 [Desulfosporosinus sp.]|nr:hypothetical protein [Desulfosporosinus sp.]